MNEYEQGFFAYENGEECSGTNEFIRGYNDARIFWEDTNDSTSMDLLVSLFESDIQR